MAKMDQIPIVNVMIPSWRGLDLLCGTDAMLSTYDEEQPNIARVSQRDRDMMTKGKPTHHRQPSLP